MIGSTLLMATMITASPATGSLSADLDVPVVAQTPQRCGQAALEMVFRYYGAGDEALREADRAYDAALRGSLITDLAQAARRAGYDATIATQTTDSLVALLAAGVPPIVLYQSGQPPLTVAHFGVVTGWNCARGTFTLNEGKKNPRTIQVDDFSKRWRTAGSQVLIVRRTHP